MGLQIAPEDFTGLQTAAADDVFRLQIEHACFGGEHEQAVFRQ